MYILQQYKLSTWSLDQWCHILALNRWLHGSSHLLCYIWFVEHACRDMSTSVLPACTFSYISGNAWWVNFAHGFQRQLAKASAWSQLIMMPCLLQHLCARTGRCTTISSLPLAELRKVHLLGLSISSNQTWMKKVSHGPKPHISWMGHALLWSEVDNMPSCPEQNIMALTIWLEPHKRFLCNWGGLSMCVWSTSLLTIRLIRSNLLWTNAVN